MNTSSISYCVSGDWIVLRENLYGVRVLAGYTWDKRTPKYGIDLLGVTVEQVIVALTAAQTPFRRCYIERTFDHEVGYIPALTVHNPLMEVNSEYGNVRLFPGVEILLTTFSGSTRVIVDQAR